MKVIQTLITLPFLFLFCNCTPQENQMLLKKAETMLNEYPDSALFYLESIPAPEQFGIQDYNDYQLLLIQAKDKSRQDISKESAIFTLNNYYKKDPEKAALVSFYCGKIHYLKKEYEEAVTYYQEAESKIELVNNLHLKGLIHFWTGQLFYQQLLSSEAIERFKIAEQYFIDAEKYTNLISTYNQIGNCFLIQEEDSKQYIDSAFYYYNKCIEIADIHTPVSHATIRNNIGAAALMIGDTQKARNYFKEALSFQTTSQEDAVTYFNLAKSFLYENQTDSFYFYTNKVLDLMEDPENKKTALNVYKTLSSIEENNSNYPKALQYYKSYVKTLDEILDSDHRNTILEMEKKYNYQKLQNQSMAKIISQQNIILLLLILLVVFLSMGIYWLYRYMKNAKELLEAKNNIQKLVLLSQKGQDQNNKMRPVVVEAFGILTKIALLEEYLKEEDKKHGSKILKKVNEIVYKEDAGKWEKLFETANALYNGLFYKLQQDYPELDSTDLKLCCLTLGELSNTEIGLIMQYQPTTIQAKKSQLRKKVNIQPQGDIRKYLLEKYK